MKKSWAGSIPFFFEWEKMMEKAAKFFSPNLELDFVFALLMAWLGFSRNSYAVACFEPTSVELYQTGTFQMLYQLKEKKKLPGPGVDPAPFQLGSSVPFLRPFVHFSVRDSFFPNWQPLTTGRPCCSCRQPLPPKQDLVCVHPEELPSKCLTNKLPQPSPSR